MSPTDSTMTDSSTPNERSAKHSVVAENELTDVDVFLINVVVMTGMSVATSLLIRWITHKFQNLPRSRWTMHAANDRLTNILIEREAAADAEEDVSGYDLQKLKRAVVPLQLNEYETIISQDVMDPRDITISFADIGGIDDIKAELWDLVVFPLIRPDLFRSESGLVTPPRGILLYGAPGTGKTMLAKAIAKESKAAFFNIRLSSIMDKWFGESNKLVAATFSLAHKLAPSVIFIDEIDTFLCQRDSSEGSATTSMKSEFLTLWDGMTTDSINSTPVMVLCATNRPYDVDNAILRRLPRTFEIGLPSIESRIQILKLFLMKQPTTEQVRDMIPDIAEDTEGYSGSDLKELCRAAAMEPIREFTTEQSRNAVTSSRQNSESRNDMDSRTQTHHDKLRKGSQTVGTAPSAEIRPVNARDFMVALKKVKRSGQTAQEFLKREHSKSSRETDPTKQAFNANLNELGRNIQLVQALLAGKDGNKYDYGKSENVSNNGDLDDLANE